MKVNVQLLGVGILTALASSLCCIVPFLAFLAGVSGVASSFSWLEPLRPWFSMFTIAVLGLAWYQRLRSSTEVDCACEQSKKPSFWQSGRFLALMTVFALAMLLFPYYVGGLYPDTKQGVVETVVPDTEQEVIFDVVGMTCAGCEEHIVYEVGQLEGVFEVAASYKDAEAVVKFDKNKVRPEDIEAAIAKAGYSASVK